MGNNSVGIKEAYYCFLNNIYCDNAEPVLYELILSDEQFTRTSLFRVSLPELRQVYTETKAIKDWYFDGDYLKCNSEIDEVPITDIIAETKGQLISCNSDESSFFEFLRVGESHGYLVVTGNVAKSQGDWDGAEISPFRRIHFSASTMTSYVQIFSSEGLRNLMLVVINDGVLSMNEFYYAVPEEEVQSIVSDGHVFPGQYVCHKRINGAEYRIYNSGMLPIYENSMILSKPLINRAMNCRMRADDVVHAAKRFISGFFSQLDTQSEEIKWVGGTKDYRTKYGVYFKSARKPASRKSLDSLIQLCVRDIMPKCNSFTEAVQELDEQGLNTDGRFIAKMLVAGLFASRDNSGDSMLAGITLLQDTTERSVFYADLFLYQVRVYMYLTQYMFLGFGYNSRVLAGGCETNSTIIEEVFYERPE